MSLALPRSAAPGPAGVSDALRRAVYLAQRAARRRLPVLLVGETGTGKECLARLVHGASGRRGRFVDVNCGALPRELVEGLCFGHERGAFSGAHASREGYLREAHGGTLFLDELSSLPIAAQPVLLRALELGEVRRVGAARAESFDAQLVAALHDHPDVAIASGRLRSDLAYRLCGILIQLPPLRERMDDVIPIARQMAGELGLSIAADALPVLLGHDWPGNARELRQILLRASVLVEDSDAVDAAALNEALALGVTTAVPSAGEIVGTHDEHHAEMRSRVKAALREASGRAVLAARILGVSRATMYRWCQRYGLGRYAAGAPWP
ncbi:MAG: sigma 54-interacting transcriptional regulator [Gemmatimonadales bacterium]|nr:sigma 54-interacting transcriptional regulator [Gemmatimonadales bacterium]